MRWGLLDRLCESLKSIFDARKSNTGFSRSLAMKNAQAAGRIIGLAIRGA
jgi:hypothetical protein